VSSERDEASVDALPEEDRTGERRRKALAATRGPLLGWRRTMWGFVASTAGVAAVTALYFLPHHPPALIAGLLYLLVVVVATSLGGFWPGFTAAVLSCIPFDYFFMPPMNSFGPGTIANPGSAKLDTLIALGIFLAVAIVIVPVINREQNARARAVLTQERLEFLLEASEVLSSSLDSRRTLPDVIRLSVPTVADWAGAFLVGEANAIEPIAVAWSDPRSVRELEDPRPIDPAARIGLANVLRTGRSELYSRVPRELRETLSRDPGGFRLLTRERLRSYLAVPILAGGLAVGAIAMATGRSRRRLGRGDLALAEDMARRTSSAMENAMLYQERDHIARTLQRGLLPRALPEIPGIELAARYRAAGVGNEVGGDFYDVFDTGPGTWGAVVGDVSGKGPEAAAVTGLARHTIRALAAVERTPSRILAGLNERLVHEEAVERFVTVCYVGIEAGLDGVHLTVASGGHPPPVILRGTGEVEPVGGYGTLLGIFPDPTLLDRTVDLSRDETIVLYTDGLTEPFARESLEAGELGRLLADSVGLDAEAIADRLAEEVIKRSLEDRPEDPSLRLGDAALRDDVCILVLRAAEPPSAEASSRGAARETEGRPVAEAHAPANVGTAGGRDIGK
jgi:serine phosphatase RsbU (regulator of sigma subunit)